MGLFSNWASGLISAFNANSYVLPAGIVLAKADESGDVLKSNGSGAALVSSVVPTTATAITASDSTDVTATTAGGILVGGAGNLAVRTVGAPSTTVTIAVVAGQYVPVQCTRVMAATTATGIVGLS